MTARPSVSVVMPFAGSAEEARAAVDALARLRTIAGDERVLADNAGVLVNGAGRAEVSAANGATVVLVHATGERSPAHARNAGAAAATAANQWILFLDADTIAPADLLDRFFAAPIDADVGALAGGIAPAADQGGVAVRYAAHKNFLDAGAHLAHPYLPRAAAANLLVRRAAFDAVGGFFEGLRAAEDTDFSWRLQRAGWRLASRPEATVEHRYRDSVQALRHQWRAYAAGRAWLGRRYDGFTPRPALARLAGRRSPRPASATVAFDPPAPAVPLRDRAAFAALDGMLGVEELIGFAQPNRPAADDSAPAAVAVVVAGRFPDPAIAVAPGAHVEALARPARAQPAPSGVTVAYREDDGLAERTVALARLARAAPGVVFAAVRADVAGTLALSPAALRLRACPAAALTAACPDAADDERRLARLAGR
jgi:GT2 family glycosyltransferase